METCCLWDRQVSLQDTRVSLDMEPQISELLEQEAMGLDEKIWGAGIGQDRKSWMEPWERNIEAEEK